ncbi:hypothetical protein O181_027623 [Austropuccinia psidii MF-1]|uniref:Uncharacterized protein n=1 Tax=Austropuccinia psidii MF-1 TaxID=1389203 RepID=A0A9Q3CPX6_9BASI|nr:hypothetical protein [Austropuccinia psidii MF-1]
MSTPTHPHTSAPLPLNMLMLPLHPDPSHLPNPLCSLLSSCSHCALPTCFQCPLAPPYAFSHSLPSLLSCSPPQDMTPFPPSPLLMPPHPCLIFSTPYNPYGPVAPSR